MASEYLTGRGSSSHSAGDASASAAPGKRTLTGGLSPTFGVRAQDDAGASLGGLAFLSVTAARPGASEVDPFFFAQPGGVSPSAGVVDAAATVGLGDVSGVQLHVNAAAHELAASHDAHAVTFGQDIHFAAGAYAPETDAGARLLGHELAHAAQQRYATPVAAAKARTTSTGDTVENEADAAGESFLQALGGREVAPVRITPSVMAVARFQGAAPAARTLTQPPVGNQNAPGPTRDPIAAGRQAARNARRREARESDLEVPNPTIRPGGAPPDFVTVSDQSAQSTMGHDADVPHDSVIGSDPAAPIAHQPVSTPLPQILYDNEVERLLRYSRDLLWARKPDTRPYVLVSLILQTAIKKSECMGIKLEHLDSSDPRAPVLYVRYPTARMRHKERKLVLSPQFMQVVRQYIAQYKPETHLFECTARNLEYVLGDAGDLAGIEHKSVSFEALRWTAAVRDYRTGMPPEQLRKKLGLSQISWRETGMKIRQLAGPAL